MLLRNSMSWTQGAGVGRRLQKMTSYTLRMVMRIRSECQNVIYRPTSFSLGTH